MRYKLHIVGADESRMDRNSAWARCALQGDSGLFDCVFWDPPAAEQHQWQHPDPVPPVKATSDRIYESHVGMAHEGEAFAITGRTQMRSCLESKPLATT